MTPQKPYFHYFCLCLIPAAIITLFIPKIGSYSFAILAVAIAFNIITYYRSKAKNNLNGDNAFQETEKHYFLLGLDI